MVDNDELKLLLQERKSLKHEVSAEEWEARVELAACYRLIAHFRMTDWIYNHISARVPGDHKHYLINPFGLLYEEVSASSLVKVDVQGRLAEEIGLDVGGEGQYLYEVLVRRTRVRPGRHVTCRFTRRLSAIRPFP